jgi:hypothetical protein
VTLVDAAHGVTADQPIVDVGALSLRYQTKWTYV